MTSLDDTQKEYADTIARAGNTLLQLVNDILDFSKMEAGQLSIENIAFDLPEVLEDVRSMLAVKARQRGLSLKVEVQEGMPRRLRGDPTRLKQVLVNLVGNAIKFTPQGGVTVEARANANLDGAWAVEVAVKDTGIGIAPEQLDRVFEAFTQADSSTTRKFGGTGLGLAISSQLARLMGGELRLESELERGSTFTLCLSLEEAERKSRVPSLPPGAQADAQGLTQARVLLVEDNLENQGMGKKLLEALGCTVEVANDGEEAVSRVEQQKFDVVLKFDVVFMDCNMPNMNGFDATR
jgi:K+-sensing histidine kinase KdpD